MSGQSVSRALTRLADLTAEAVGSAHGGVAAAVRGVLRLGRDRSVVVVGRDGTSATMRLHESRFSGMDTIGSQLLSGSYEPTTRRVLEALVTSGAVSYTHLDVYKRQGQLGLLGHSAAPGG